MNKFALSFLWLLIFSSCAHDNLQKLPLMNVEEVQAARKAKDKAAQTSQDEAVKKMTREAQSHREALMATINASIEDPKEMVLLTLPSIFKRISDKQTAPESLQNLIQSTDSSAQVLWSNEGWKVNLLAGKETLDTKKIESQKKADFLAGLKNQNELVEKNAPLKIYDYENLIVTSVAEILNHEGNQFTRLHYSLYYLGQYKLNLYILAKTSDLQPVLSELSVHLQRFQEKLMLAYPEGLPFQTENKA